MAKLSEKRIDAANRRHWENERIARKNESETTGTQYFTRPIEIKEIKKYARGKTLDVGCGSGYILKQLKVDVVGIDTSKTLINLALKQGLNVEIGDATKLPFKDKTFDTVYTIRTIINLNRQEQLRAVDEAYRVLRPGGRLLWYEGVKSGVSAINTLPLVAPLHTNPVNRYLDARTVRHLKKTFRVKKIKSYPATHITKSYARTFFSGAKKKSENLERSYTLGKIIHFFDPLLAPLLRRYSEFNLFIAEKG